MKILAILLCGLTFACVSDKGPHYDDGYSDASSSMYWHGECVYYVTHSTPINDVKFVQELKANDCRIMTGQYDYQTTPLAESIKYYEGHNDYIEEYIIENSKRD